MNVTFLLLLVVRMSISTHLSEKVCEKYFYGDECYKKCLHCDEPCNNVTGRCMDGCSPGWMGERCDEGCLLGNGETYRGTLSETVRGYPCLYWLEMNTNLNHEADLFRNHNYCRNPRGKNQHPWCFVDVDNSYDYCVVPNCPSNNIKECTPYFYGKNCSKECVHCPEPCNNVSGLCMDGCLPGWTGDRCDKGCLMGDGQSYDGTLSTTINGYTCLSWKIYRPMPELHWKAQYDHNFCRNWGTSHRPYCFVDKGRGVTGYDDCSIDECPENKNASLCPKYYFGQLCQHRCYRCKQTCNNVIGTCPEGCYPGWTGEKCDEETNCLPDDTIPYYGTWHTTVDGETCAIWKTVSVVLGGVYFGYKHNFCRSLSNRNGIWCYVNNGLKACDIPKCSEQTVAPTESTDEPLTEYMTSYYVAEDLNGAATPLPTVCTCVTIIVNIMAACEQINK